MDNHEKSCINVSNRITELMFFKFVTSQDNNFEAILIQVEECIKAKFWMTTERYIELMFAGFKLAKCKSIWSNWV